MRSMFKKLRIAILLLILLNVAGVDAVLVGHKTAAEIGWVR